LSRGQVMPNGLYTSRELALILSRHRQQAVPQRTLRWWRGRIGIDPTPDGFYQDSDLEILIQLVRWLNRGGTVKAFKQQLRSKVNAT
jgi:DNA-binding transcriptional MerR regulator